MYIYTYIYNNNSHISFISLGLFERKFWRELRKPWYYHATRGLQFSATFLCTCWLNKRTSASTFSNFQTADIHLPWGAVIFARSRHSLSARRRELHVCWMLLERITRSFSQQTICSSKNSDVHQEQASLRDPSSIGEMT